MEFFYCVGNANLASIFKFKRTESQIHCSNENFSICNYIKSSIDLRNKIRLIK